MPANLDARFVNSTDVPPPSQAEAETGTSNTPRLWTAERVNQAIAALAGSGGGGGAPIGAIIPFGGTIGSIPSGWLPCDGFAYGRTGGDANPQAGLFAVIGTTWGIGDGSTTFNIPDFRGKSPVGINDAGTPNGLDGGFTARAVAATGGEEAHTTTQGEMPSHSHPLQNFSAQFNAQSQALSGNGANVMTSASSDFGVNLALSSISNPTSPTGGGGAHNTMHPFAVVAYIIKADQTSSPGNIGISNSTAITSSDTAIPGERVLYDPSGGTFTINAPAGPALGEKFAVKNRSTDLTIVTISGNGNNIENPTASFALAASFTLSGNGISVEWEYDGTQWLAI